MPENRSEDQERKLRMHQRQYGQLSCPVLPFSSLSLKEGMSKKQTTEIV